MNLLFSRPEEHAEVYCLSRFAWGAEPYLLNSAVKNYPMPALL